MRPGVSPPSLPEYDASDPVESAIVRRLASNWARRATVKKAEPELDDLFDSSLSDYPEALLPFAEHPTYLALSPEQKQRLQAWAWIAFNKNVMDIEKYVVNPGFDVLAEDRLGVGLGDWAAVAVNQAMVDEQYHTLMHFNASSATRRGRGWGLPAKALPDVLTVRTRAQALDAAEGPRKIALTQLAFMTVAEVSITAYLDLISDDRAFSRSTARQSGCTLATSTAMPRLPGTWRCWSGIPWIVEIAAIYSKVSRTRCALSAGPTSARGEQSWRSKLYPAGRRCSTRSNLRQKIHYSYRITVGFKPCTERLHLDRGSLRISQPRSCIIRKKSS